MPETENVTETQGPIKNKTKLIILIIAIAAAVVAGFVLYVKLKKSEQPGPADNKQEITRSGRVYSDPQKNYPPSFPQGLPLDKPLDVIDNSQVKITYPTRAQVPGTVSGVTYYRLELEAQVF